MNYPVWFLPGTGGGLLIAFIAIVHVFVSHFAVGGGLYLVMAERKGLRENNLGILEFTKKHAKFFMLVSMVFGGITGVGIWFIIALVQPAAVSSLIHTFVYGWAAEWVWFLVEIIALIVYYYTFGKMDSRTHQIVGWIYFIAAWMSLFLINGIIGFMLTPGAWVENQNFWVGFFNPSFWPALFVRSCIAFMLAGLYAFVTSAFLKDRALRITMTRFSGKWALISLLLALPSAWWYLSILPEPAAKLVQGASPTISTAATYALYSLIVLFILALLLAVVRPAINTPAVALLTLIPAFLLFGAFEWTREAARRPFVINQLMYSNGVTVAQAAELGDQSFLAQTKFSAVHDITDDNLAAAGAELFKFQCYACHTIGGINNDILPRTAAMDAPGLTKYLLNVIHKRPYMPPFLGTEQEAQALAAYIVGDLHRKPVELATASVPTGAGQQVYDNNCIGCHELDLVVAWANDQSAGEISTGLLNLSEMNDAMENFAGTDEERQQLAAYLHGLGNPVAAAEPEDPGVTLYDNNCIGCHSKETVLNWAAGQNEAEIAAGLTNLGALNPMMAGISLEQEDCVTLACHLAAVATPQAAAAEPAPETPPATPEADSQTILDNLCTGCHSKATVIDWAAGKSTADIAAGLADLGQLNPMMGGLSLEETDRSSLATWLQANAEGGAQ